MMSIDPPRSTPDACDRTNEKGGLLVEVTMVVPVLIFLVLGMLEIGMAWSDAQVVTQAARAGARTVTQLPEEELADQQALLAVQAAFSQQDISLHQVTVFEADADGNPVSTCEGSVPVASGQSCNIYPLAVLDFATLSDVTRWGCNQSGRTNTLDDNWCPSETANRDPNQRTATWIGVRVVGERSWITGFFGKRTHQITETAVMRLEPRP